MGTLKATTISTRSGAMKAKPWPRIGLEAELEGLPLLVNRLTVGGPPFGVLEPLHGLVLFAGRVLAELVLGQQRIEVGTGPGVGDHLSGLGLVLSQRHLLHQPVARRL